MRDTVIRARTGRSIVSVDIVCGRAPEHPASANEEVCAY